MFPTGYSLSKHLGFTSTYFSHILSRTISFSNSDSYSLLGSIVVTNSGAARPGILVDRTWHCVSPDEFPQQLVTHVDNSFTPSVDICVPQYQPLTYTLIPRRFFEPSFTNFDKNSEWSTFKIGFHRANRSKGKLIAHFPCVLIKKGEWKCNHLISSFNDIVRVLPFS